MKIYYAAAESGKTEIIDFITGLEPKMRAKLMSQLALLMQNPTIGEPHVKHFSISKYNRLFELRTRSKTMLRIIFAFYKDDGIILLTPFIKKHTRNTMQALDESLKLFSQLEAGTLSIKELPIQKILEELK